MTKVIDRIAELEGLGFKRWQKFDKDRLYINADALGLVCEYYNTGNICYAEFDGEKISNSRAYRMKSAKTYIDVATGKIYSDDSTLRKVAAELAGLEIA